MQHLLKTLHVTTQGTFLRLDGDAIRAELPDAGFARLPLEQLGEVCLHGRVAASTELIRRLVDDGITLTYLSRSGRFNARVSGGVTGNILLRCAQFDFRHDEVGCVRLAREIVTGKVLNARVLVLDTAKDAGSTEAARLRADAESLASLVRSLPEAETLDAVRGLEGQAARVYLAVLGALPKDPLLRFETRSRRPPLDPTNALLSLFYALLRGRCCGALEAVGLDPQLGFLHSVRPGRDSLALDLMEELRSPFVDRFALRAINRRQVTPADFVTRPGGAVELTDGSRRRLLALWDTFLSERVRHRVLDRDIERRFVPHVQAALLARLLRGEVEHYLPFRVAGR